MKRRVMGTLVAVAIVFYLFVFPQALIDHVVSLAAEKPNPWVGLFAGAGGNVSFVLVLSFILFASDSAFRGTNKYARWAQSRYAARAAVDALGCKPEEAAALWFKYFDTWGIDGSPNRNLLINSYAATYSARAIFYLQRAVGLFVALAVLSILLHWKAFAAYSDSSGKNLLVVHTLTLSLLVAAWILLVATNRISDPESGGAATGCWSKVEDVFGRSRVLFEQEILSGISTVEDGFARVESIRSSLLP